MTAVEHVIGYRVCAYCGGNGCGRCAGDGELPQYATEEPDEELCVDCGQPDQYELRVGRCRSCDYEEELRWGYIPSHLGLRGGPE